MIRGYLRHRRAVFALYAVVAAAFPAVQALYGLPLVPTLYSLLIVTFLLALAAAGDFLRYAGRARRLDGVLANLSDAANELPEAVGPIEARYHDLAAALYALHAEQTEALSLAHAEQLDYYTMWVHQIKTPIAAMRLSLQRGVKPELLEIELMQVERYVEMALSFVKLSDLSSDLVIREYPLGPIVSGVVKKYAPLFIGKRLRVDITDVDFPVTTDSKWLAFILEQLVSNAIKYTEKGGVRIRGGKGSLTVEDTGVGIRAEDLPRVFDKGYTGYNGRVDRRASGLGLYMSTRVARQLSIRLYADSTPGEGTVMTLVFPQKDHFLQ